MKETELWEILVSLSANEISLAETHDQILRLFNVVGQSEQCVHEFNVDETSEIPFDLICEKCGKTA